MSRGGGAARPVRTALIGTGVPSPVLTKETAETTQFPDNALELAHLYNHTVSLRVLAPRQ